MTTDVITSLQHPLVKQAGKLAQKRTRQETGEILVETVHPVTEAIKAGLTPVHIFLREDFNWDNNTIALPQALVTHVSTDVMKKLGTTETASPIAAIFKTPQPQLPDSQNAILVLDEIQDPGNAGTLIRSAVAFGYDAVVTTKGSVDCYSPKVIRASAGLVFRLPVVSSDQIDLNAFNIYVTDLNQKATPLNQTIIKKPFAVVLGNEAHGIGKQFQAMENTHCVYIPMHQDVDSLNVAISGSILMQTFGNLE